MLKPIHQDPNAYEEICSVCPLPPKLIGEKVFLTAFSPDYTDLLLKYATDEYVMLGLGNGLYRAHTRASEEKLLVERGCTLDGGFNFFIWDRENTKIIGTASIIDINLACRNALLGINIADAAYRHGGRGTGTLTLLLDFGFYTLGLHNIGLYSFEYNTEAIACYERLGFTRSGRTRETRWAQGRYWDSIYMDMLDREWFDQRKIIPTMVEDKPRVITLGEPDATPQNTRYAARAIICRGDEVLLMHEAVGDQWMLPGGGREEGEDPKQCCIREVEEETGLSVVPCEHLFVLDERYGEWKYVSDYFVCEVVGTGEAHLTQEEADLGTESKWVSFDDAIEIFADWENNEPATTRHGLYLREYTALDEYDKTGHHRFATKVTKTVPIM